MKKFISLLLILSLAFPFSTLVSADEETGLNFEGDADKFVQVSEGELFGNFKNLYPGEERVQKVVLTNNDHREMKFYLSANDLDAFREIVAGNIAYDIDFFVDGNELFTGEVGGEDNVGTDAMSENMLIATLAQGEEAVLEMRLKTDGDSMDNTYQNAIGNLEFTFSVEYDDAPVSQPEKIYNYIVEKVYKEVINTGDDSSIMPFAIAGGACVVVIVLLLVAKKKKEGKENEK